MVRGPAKDGIKKGPWNPEEDLKLIDYIQKHGPGNWRNLPKNAGLQRCGKSCRLRWTNYLRPDIKRGRFSFEEEETIIQLHSVLGNKWSAIAARLPGRTDNEIKNYWNIHIKKRLLRMGIDPVTHSPRLNLLDLSSTVGSSPSNPSLLHLSNLLNTQALLNPELLKLVSTILSVKQENANGIAENVTSSSILDEHIGGNFNENSNFQTLLNPEALLDPRSLGDPSLLNPLSLLSTQTLFNPELLRLFSDIFSTKQEHINVNIPQNFVQGNNQIPPLVQIDHTRENEFQDYLHDTNIRFSTVATTKAMESPISVALRQQLGFASDSAQENVTTKSNVAVSRALDDHFVDDYNQNLMDYNMYISNFELDSIPLTPSASIAAVNVSSTSKVNGGAEDEKESYCSNLYTFKTPESLDINDYF